MERKKRKPNKEGVLGKPSKNIEIVRAQEELAWQAEMTREQLGRIERDQCLPSVETIGRLEKSLNLEPMTLLKLKIIPELCDFQMTEEEKSVNIVCRELEIALISNLTKPDMLKACDVISTISDLLNHQE